MKTRMRASTSRRIAYYLPRAVIKSHSHSRPVFVLAISVVKQSERSVCLTRNDDPAATRADTRSVSESVVGGRPAEKPSRMPSPPRLFRLARSPPQQRIPRRP